MGVMKPIIPPPVIGLLFAIAMWMLAKGAADLTGDYSIILPGQAWAAALIAGAGLAIDLVSIAAFFRRKTTVNPLTPSKTNTLVVDGFYSFSRNPMYLGILMILTGWTLWLGNILNLVLLGLFIWVINELQIKPEEKALRKKFGAEYEAYCKRVRRWI